MGLMQKKSGTKQRRGPWLFPCCPLSPILDLQEDKDFFHFLYRMKRRQHSIHLGKPAERIKHNKHEHAMVRDIFCLYNRHFDPELQKV